MRGAAHAAVLHGAAQCWDEIPPTLGPELGPGVAWEWHGVMPFVLAGFLIAAVVCSDALGHSVRSRPK